MSVFFAATQFVYAVALAVDRHLDLAADKIRQGYQDPLQFEQRKLSFFLSSSPSSSTSSSLLLTLKTSPLAHHYYNQYSILLRNNVFWKKILYLTRVRIVPHNH